MTLLPIPLMILDTLVLLGVIVATFFMLRWAYWLNRNIGDFPVTSMYMWRILRTLVIMLLIVLATAILNLAFL